MIPTNKQMIRIDFPDVIYKTEREKFKAVVDEIKELYDRGQPVLVGTISIEKSEMLSKMLKRAGIPHSVLNAKHHEKEAEIVAQRGPEEDGDHLHQHGGPRYRYRAGRRGARTGRASHPGHRTARKPPHRQPAQGPLRQAGRPGHPRVSIFPWRTICSGSSALTGFPPSWSVWAWKRASPSSTT